jgi:hypothetical protein
MANSPWPRVTIDGDLDRILSQEAGLDAFKGTGLTNEAEESKNRSG